MNKLSNTEVELKKSVVYKKMCSVKNGYSRTYEEIFMKTLNLCRKETLLWIFF